MATAVRWGALAVAVFLALSGLAKFADLAEFQRALESWTLLPAWGRPVAVLLVPLAEFLVGVAFVAMPSTRRKVGALMVAMLATITLAYTIQFIVGGVPDCGCWGMLNRYITLRQSALTHISISGGCLILACVWLWAEGGCHQSAVMAMDRSCVLLSNARRAFSLVEVLVVLLVIAVVIGLTVPALAHARRGGRQTVTLNNARQHAGVMTSYAGDFRECPPYVTVPSPGQSSPIPEPGNPDRMVRYFDAAWYWRDALTPGYYNGNWNSASLTSPFDRLAWIGAADYSYPCVFLADPDYWRPETRTYPAAQLRAVRLQEVQYPSHKVFVVDDAMWFYTLAQDKAGPSTAVGCVDGHAERVHERRMAAQYGSGDGGSAPFNEYTWHFSSFSPLLHTRGGVRERDFRDDP